MGGLSPQAPKSLNFSLLKICSTQISIKAWFIPPILSWVKPSSSFLTRSIASSHTGSLSTVYRKFGCSPKAHCGIADSFWQ